MCAGDAEVKLKLITEGLNRFRDTDHSPTTTDHHSEACTQPDVT